MVGQTVEERAGEALVAEGGGPFVEGQVRGDDRRALLVALTDEFEHQLGARLRERHEAKLVDDQQLVACERLLQPQQAFLFPRFHQLVDDRRGGGEARLHASLTCGDAETDDKMGFPDAARPERNDVFPP